MSKTISDWDKVLSAASRLQHFISRDADHVMTDLRGSFDKILADIESVAGWQTNRISRPVQILGDLDGIETGIRQLIRTQPLETTLVYYKGQPITVPTKGELLRIKSALVLKRNATRDYLDVVALADNLGPQRTLIALRGLDDLYPQPNGASALQQLEIQLSHPMPFDLDATNLAEYKNLDSKSHSWSTVQRASRQIAKLLFDHE